MIGQAPSRATATGLSGARSEASKDIDSASERAFRIAKSAGGASQQSFSSWEIVFRMVE
jgi:hypothetical protein